ncbi:MAG: PAS domain S-box protein [Bradyrhizobiaceae bacterium]|nr:PAS domain S-box protein [Bradyrhizobiaceae bacterium]
MLAEVVPGVHGAIARARSGGSAEVQFGVLRVLLQRLGTEGNFFFIAAFLAPAREEAEAIAPAVREAPQQAEIPAAVSEPAPGAPEPAVAVAIVTEAPAETRPSEAPEVAAEAEPREEVSAAEESASEPEAPPAAAPPGEPAPLPRRFVWQTDAEGRFTSVSPELAAVVGELPAAIAGLDWNEAGERIGIDGTAAVAEAVARRDTWSGVSVQWPIEGSELARPVDLAALPVFDRERRFLGYRGFGVFREPVPRPAREAAIAREEPPVFADEPAEKPAPGLPPRFAEPAPRVRTHFGKRTDKIVPLHKPETPRPSLTAIERSAFREIAKVIGARMQRVNVPPAEQTSEQAHPLPGAPSGERAILGRLPVGVVVHRSGHILYANRAVLEWTGVAGVDELAAAGGLERLFANGQGFADETGESSRPVALRGRGAHTIPVDARLISAPWDGETALVYLLSRTSGVDHDRLEATELALRDAEASTREMHAILDTATDGVALLDREGHVLGMNRSAEALFGFDSGEIEGRSFTTLFAPESHRAALDYLDGLASNGVASVLNDGREVIGRVREGGLIPLFMTLGRVGEGGEKFCAVFRDITQWKRAEEELVQARRQAERANSAKSEFLAKISHEIRTPLSSIIGFAEVMMEERLGPIANERYREYLKDIHTSGEHLISLINDLLDLSKIEAGKLDLVFSSVDLNEIASQSMALMQPQANRERIIIRTALAPNLPPVVADARSIRQIVLNLLSNSIRFTPPGGQVIVSTTLTDDGEVHLRVRDTGIGMTETEIKTALEPFRQITTAGHGKEGGTGLGLPLTKALAEANRASFSIKSTKNAGTLVEIAFPSTRVLAE